MTEYTDSGHVKVSLTTVWSLLGVAFAGVGLLVTSSMYFQSNVLDKIDNNNHLLQDHARILQEIKTAQEENHQQAEKAREETAEQVAKLRSELYNYIYFHKLPIQREGYTAYELAYPHFWRIGANNPGCNVWRPANVANVGDARGLGCNRRGGASVTGASILPLGVYPRCGFQVGQRVLSLQHMPPASCKRWRTVA